MPDAVDSPRPRFTINPVAIIVVCAVSLTILGLTILFSASAYFKEGPYYYLGKQLVGVVLAIGLGWMASRVNLDYLRRYVWVIGGTALFLLAAVLVPHLGVAVKGSRRWLGYGPLRLQVSEFAKLAMVFCLAHYVAINQTKIDEIKRGYIYPLAIIGIFCALVLKEPDFGTAALLLVVGLTLLFLAGAKWRFIVPTVVMALIVFAVAMVHNANRLERFVSFLDVEGNKQGGTYQLYQSEAAFAEGGMTGVGLGNGRQQHNFLPEANNDFIAAVLGEELGLWATLGVAFLFTTMFVAGLVHLRRAPNLFQFLLATGCLLLICLQAIVNLGVVTGIFPTKGMSLPFISAGLSNLLLMGLLLGILANTQRIWSRPALAVSGGGFKEVFA
jgi:cell division protein FtsW